MTEWEATYNIYRIVCFPTGQVYVGMAQIVKPRMKQHFSSLRKGQHCNKLLQSAFNEYGEAAFYHEILERGLSRKEVDAREQHWVAEFNSAYEGFNLTFGGKTGFSKPLRKYRHSTIQES